jgi:cytochrome c biogenesis protein CcmG/thiol:disulfide interchange protein DsbE
VPFFRRSARRGPAFWAVALSLAACRPSAGDRAPGAAPAPAAPTAPTVPGAAPAFALKALTGETLSLEALKGNVVFLDFWATWCPPCRISMPAVERLHADYQGKPVRVIGVSIDEDIDALRAFVKKKGTPYPVLMDPDSATASAYGADGIPHFVVVDRAGRLVDQWSGFAPGFSDDWRKTIDRLLQN